MRPRKNLLTLVAPLLAGLTLTACGGGEDGGGTPSYTVTATAGPGGVITPASQIVTEGQTTAFTLTPDTDYGIQTVTGCNGMLAGNIYTTGPITADCQVTASFAIGYSIGGTLTGLGEGVSIVLQNNGGYDLTRDADGPFIFSAKVGDGGSYAVTIAQQPAGQQCEVINGAGAGTVNGADVTDVTVGNCIVVPPPVPEVTLDYGIKELRFSWEPVGGTTHYKLLENADGVSGYTQVGADLTATEVKHEIALHHRINARYQVEACNSAGCTGSAEIFMADQLVAAIGYFKASNTEATDFFGAALALSGDGKTLAVGGAPVNNSGAVYIFSLSDAGWVQQAHLPEYGSSLALSYYGDTLAVDVVGWGSNNSPEIYVRSGTQWSHQATIESPLNPFYVGCETIALSADGNTLACGSFTDWTVLTGINPSYFSNDGVANDSGAVLIFVRSGTTWSEQAFIKQQVPEDHDEFGRSVALSANGNTLAVGAPGEDNDLVNWDSQSGTAAPFGIGAVSLYTRSGTTWTLKTSSTGKEQGDLFGGAVALSGDGLTLAVGAIGEDSAATGVDGDQTDNSASFSGAVYVYRLSGASWLQQAYLKASNTEQVDLFGSAVSLSNDGNTLAVRAIWEDSGATGINGSQSDNSAGESGSVYLFTRDTTWSQKAYIKASNTEPGDGGTGWGEIPGFALSADGNTLAVGNAGEDSAATGIGGDQADNSAVDSGAVYLY